MYSMTHGPLATAPRALILDYGGVVVTTAKRPTGPAELADTLAAALRRAGAEVPVEVLERSVRAGVAALRDYNNMSSRRREPRELTHREIVMDFLASDLPDRARLVLGADAARLCEAKVRLLSEHTVRPGVRELLVAAKTRGIRTGIASNAQSGAAHRALIEANGLTSFIDVQLYSDEFGVRKPHPDMLHTVADALGVPISKCWYVGDTRDRDLVAGRRAAVGAVILIRHHHTDTPPYAVDAEPDATFDEVTGLVPALAAATEEPAPAPPATAARVAARSGSGRPQALLLDNGGVLSLSEKNPEGVRGFAAYLAGTLRRAGHDISDGQLLADLDAARERYSRWKSDHDGGERVPEITQIDFWGSMVAADWSAGARAAVVACATELTYRYVSSRATRRLRPGILAVLDFAASAGMAIGIVSNTLCGRVPRETHAAWGVEPYVGVSFFSDEFGFRKPDPSIVTACTTALGVDPADCWFVGDKRNRDIEVARAAGIGASVLISPRRTAGSLGPEPSFVVADAADLLAALQESA
jgi:HAD superfamily hydrolase (TIGR01549 family)